MHIKDTNSVCSMHKCPRVHSSCLRSQWAQTSEMSRETPALPGKLLVFSVYSKKLANFWGKVDFLGMFCAKTAGKLLWVLLGNELPGEVVESPSLEGDPRHLDAKLAGKLFTKKQHLIWQNIGIKWYCWGQNWPGIPHFLINEECFKMGHSSKLFGYLFLVFSEKSS